MSTIIIPKKRGTQASSSRIPSISGSNTGKMMSNNRILSKRLASGNRIVSNHRVISGNRHVSRSLNSDDEEINSSFGDENAIHFDENKHTILSNFEEWIKLSTDNKITSKNSWQFALIDYFHDLNVIKDGESINFQRASATLDGCVKIYSSRVESVATETGKLLSGLAKKKNNNESEDVMNEENEEDEEGTGNGNGNDIENDGRKKRKINRVVESTLVPFDTIRIKKFEQELAIDPLFKKVLSELDEGGAKSLLLNTLNIDTCGRVIFDATSGTKSDNEESFEVSQAKQDFDCKIDGLESFLFRDNDSLNELTVCPSMGQINYVLQDITKAKSLLSDVNNQFLIDDELAEKSKLYEYANNEFDYGNDYEDFGDDLDNDHNDNDPIDNMNQSIVQQIFSAPENFATTRTSEKVLDRDLMFYFDEKMKSNWRGPEHWKIAALKKNKKHIIPGNNALESTNNQAPQSRKVKEPITINFFEEDNDEDLEKLFDSPKNVLSISKPYAEDDTNGKKLPEDIQYNSSKLTNLFTKPQLPILSFSLNKKPKDTETQPLTDENFFASHYQNINDEQERLAASFHQAEFEDFNEDFGGDDDFGAIDFNDALEGAADTKPSASGTPVPESSQTLPGGRKARSDYVNFSRTAKRVDVKFLKDNLWDSIKKNGDILKNNENSIKNEIEEIKPHSEGFKTFGEVVSSIGPLYGAEQRKELSTSFCFICILHLANEHGLTIVDNEAHDDLKITGF